MKRILVPIDFTDASKTGIEHAVEVALKNAGSLILVHVRKYQSEKDARSKFDAFISEYEALKKIPHKIVIREGDIIQMLSTVATAERADFVIIATKGSSSSFEEDSIAYQMISRFKIPVLLIPHKVKYHELNKILFTVDYKEIQNVNVLKNLHRLAQAYDAKVHVLYVGEKVTIEKQDREQMENILDYFLETIDHSYDFFKQEDIEKGIADFIKEKEIDLLAMVARRHHRDSGDIKQSLVRVIALNTLVPLLTLPEM